MLIYFKIIKRHDLFRSKRYVQDWQKTMVVWASLKLLKKCSE